MNQLTNLNCDTIIFVWYLWFCQEHLAKLMEIMMDMLRGQRCWLMVSEVTELVSTGETWINFSASCSGFIFTTSLPPTVLAGSLASVRLLKRKTTESQAPGQCQVSSPSGSTLQTCTSPQTVVATSSQQQPAAAGHSTFTAAQQSWRGSESVTGKLFLEIFWQVTGWLKIK